MRGGRTRTRTLDPLPLDGTHLRSLPLIERKARLEQAAATARTLQGRPWAALRQTSRIRRPDGAQARLCDGPRGYREQASRWQVLIRPQQGVAQGEEPRGTRGETLCREKS